MTHRENLLKLARYLVGDEIAMKFDIGQFNDCGDPEQYECGTAGCAIGHGPFAGIAIQPGEVWTEYSDRCFGNSLAEWLWCFDGKWRGRDNTALGAAKRIFWMLKHGVPKGWRKQMEGTAPLCYCDMNISEFMDEANTEQLIGACHE